MITAVDVVEARIRAQELRDELERVFARAVLDAWYTRPFRDKADSVLQADARLSERYYEALAAYRAAESAAARLEAQRADEQAGVDLEVVRDTTRRILEYRGSKAP